MFLDIDRNKVERVIVIEKQQDKKDKQVKKLIRKALR